MFCDQMSESCTWWIENWNWKGSAWNRFPVFYFKFCLVLNLNKLATYFFIFLRAQLQPHSSKWDIYLVPLIAKCFRVCIVIELTGFFSGKKFRFFFFLFFIPFRWIYIFSLVYSLVSNLQPTNAEKQNIGTQ